jgi:hypothetical protein
MAVEIGIVKILNKNIPIKMGGSMSLRTMQLLSQDFLAAMTGLDKENSLICSVSFSTIKTSVDNQVNLEKERL